MSDRLSELFGLEDRVAVVTGASGVLGGAIARGLAAAGAQVGLLARRREPLEELARSLGESALVARGRRARRRPARARTGDGARPLRAGSTSSSTRPAATSPPPRSANGRSSSSRGRARRGRPAQLPGHACCRPRSSARDGRDGGSIVNVSSLAAHRALTRVVGYGAAKAAVENLTRWLAVELRPRGVRVNAVAPGFFVGEQNRALLLDESGALTERGERIVAATPAGRFGEPDELAGTVSGCAAPPRRSSPASSSRSTAASTRSAASRPAGTRGERARRRAPTRGDAPRPRPRKPASTFRASQPHVRRRQRS